MADKAATKLITVNLEAIMRTRCTFKKSFEVPADMSAEEEADLINRLFFNTDGGDFISDDKCFDGGWDQGDCTVVEGADNEGWGDVGVLARNESGVLVDSEAPST